MTILQSFVLSVIQGATEFLPVSSSGHLVLAEEMLNRSIESENNLPFVVLVHVGTLLAILFVFRAHVLRLLHYFFAEAPGRTLREGVKATWYDEPRGRMVLAIVVATFVTGVIYGANKAFFDALYEQPDKVGYALIFTALLLGSTFFRGRTSGPTPGEQTIGLFPLWFAVIIGVAQGLAIIPGISRSGSTIAVAILIGMRRSQAGEFSFLIAIPAIAGAMLLEVVKFDAATTSITVSAGLVALIVSALSGYVFLRLLLKFVRGGQFAFFGLYCLAVGVWAIFAF